jgi:hypothetical protein
MAMLYVINWNQLTKYANFLSLRKVRKLHRSSSSKFVHLVGIADHLDEGEFLPPHARLAVARPRELRKQLIPNSIAAATASIGIKSQQI